MAEMLYIRQDMAGVNWNIVLHFVGATPVFSLLSAKPNHQLRPSIWIMDEYLSIFPIHVRQNHKLTPMNDILHPLAAGSHISGPTKTAPTSTKQWRAQKALHYQSQSLSINSKAALTAFQHNLKTHPSPQGLLFQTLTFDIAIVSLEDSTP